MPSPPLNQTPRHKFKFQAIGTHWSIETSAVLDTDARRQIKNRADEFDRTYSRFRDDSIVARIGKRAGSYEFSDDVIPLMQFYRQLYDMTDGAVTPLVGRVLEQIGYDKDYSFKQGQVDNVPQWDDVMHWQGRMVTTKRPIVLDIGAAGKGYLVDCIGDILEGKAIGDYVIDASGDIRHRGPNSDQVGLENPHDTSRVIGLMNLQNASLCASASNRRAWGKGMHHIIDPRTALPTRDVIASWVMADCTMIADGLATALFFTDPKVLLREWDFQYVQLMSDGKITHSHEFMGELFI